MTVIANVFSKLQTGKDLVEPISKNRPFRTSFDIQDVNVCQALLKSAGEQFYHIFCSLWGEMTWEIYPLLSFEILWVFVNILTAVSRYPVRDCENLQFPIQMHLSQKHKTFSQFLVSFMESPSNFKFFSQKRQSW